MNSMQLNIEDGLTLYLGDFPVSRLVLQENESEGGVTTVISSLAIV